MNNDREIKVWNGQWLNMVNLECSQLGSPSTFNIGRNAKKRELREGKPRKYWRTLARDYGYAV